MANLFRIFFSPYGRLSRISMWRFGVLYPIGIGAGITLLAMLLFDNEASVEDSIFINAVYFIIFFAVLMLSIKRFHDLNLSGWWYVALLSVVLVSENMIAAHYRLDTELPPFEYYIGIIGNFSAFFPDILENAPKSFLRIGYYLYAPASLASIILTLFIRGNRGENKYGPDPLEKN